MPCRLVGSIRVSSQGPYADWLANENTPRPACYGAWYLAAWNLPNAGHPQADHLG